MIEIDRLALDQSGGCDQFIGGAGIKPEPAFKQAVQLALLDCGWFAVERDDMDQKGRRCQPIPGIVKCAILVGGERNNVGDELAKSVQHRCLCCNV